MPHYIINLIVQALGMGKDRERMGRVSAIMQTKNLLDSMKIFYGSIIINKNTLIFCLNADANVLTDFIIL